MVEQKTIKGQLDFMQQHQEFFASTCRLELENGQPDPACHRGFPTAWNSFSYYFQLEKMLGFIKLFGGYHQTWKDLSKVHEVDAISGAFLMIKKEALEKVGLFDEGFFMYAEDLDLCLRLQQAGLKIGFNPKTKAIHLKGQSGRQQDTTETKRLSTYYFWQTQQLFYKKHYANKYPRMLSWLINKVLDLKINQYKL